VNVYGVGVKREMIDTVTPGFHRKVKDGKLFFNSMSQSFTESSRVAGGEFQYRYKSLLNCSGTTRQNEIKADPNQWEFWYSAAKGIANTPGNIPPIPDIIKGQDIGSLYIELSTKVLNDRGRSDSNTWETLAESDKALGTLTGIFKDGVKTLTSSRLTAVKAGSSAYLAWRYGLKPLISDVHAVLDGLDKKVGRVRKTSRARGVLRGDAKNVITHVQGGDFTALLSEGITDIVTLRCMSLDEYVSNRLNNIGLTSKGLLTLPWELIPYSFVVDWFVNIGDFIGAMSPSLGWTQLGSCHVLKREKVLQLAPLQTTPGPAVEAILKPATGSYKLTQTSVSRQAGLSAPGLVVKSDFRFSNLTRCLDAYSLLAQQVIKKR